MSSRTLRVPTADDTQPKLVFSPLGGPVKRKGITVDVKIYRFEGRGERWQLEVVDGRGGSTCWDGLFRTDLEAYEAFVLALHQDGIASFVLPEQTAH